MNGSCEGQKCQVPGCTHSTTPKACPLSTLKVGCAGHVVSVGGDGDLRRRLLEMGFCNQTSVEVVRKAPLGDPVEFRLRGYNLSLRSDQAEHVQIVPAALSA